MLDTDIEACPVFVRWQIRCPKCGITFYVDSEPESAKEDILNLNDMKLSRLLGVYKDKRRLI